MESNIKINFENYLNKKNFSSSQKEIKESNFNNFIKNGFPNKRIEDWKFSDLKQIITTNFENIDFSKKEEQSNIEENFTFDLEHNKIVFINGIISKIDFSYEDEKKNSCRTKFKFGKRIKRKLVIEFEHCLRV